MRKDIPVLEAMKLTGKDAYELIGVNRENKQWIKRSVNTVIGSCALVEAIKETKGPEIVVTEEPKIAEVVNVEPINKPSEKFDVEDYILYREYVIANGGKPSVEDYFKARAYYESRAK